MDKIETADTKRFLGLDLGCTSSRLCYTTPDPETGRCLEPRVVTFEGSPHLLSLAVLEPTAARVVTNREDLLRLVGQAPVGMTFSPICKDKLATGDPSTVRCAQTLAETLAGALKTRLNIPAISSGAFPTTVGSLPGSPNHRQAVQNLVEAVKVAGFEDVQVYPDAAAAVLYLIFRGDLPIKDLPQSWLVVDGGGDHTRFTVVEKPGDSIDLKVRGAFPVSWGGDLIDQTLYKNFLLPVAWKGTAPPEESQKTALLLLVRELKEKLSQQGNTDAILYFQLEGIQDPVEITQQVFESENVGLPLIRQFEQLLQDERLRTNPAFQQVERIILVGGSANWSFVQEAVRNRWGADRCLMPDEPDLVVAKGLSLARTRVTPPPPQLAQEEIIFAPTISEIPPPTPQPTSVMLPTPTPLTEEEFHHQGFSPEAPRNKSAPSGEYRQKKTFHKRARKITLWCTLAGAAFALIVSPIPCAAWPVLLLLEAYMFYAIAKIYGYKITSGLLWAMIAGLLGISFVLSLAVGEIVTLLSAYMAAPIVKPLVAAVVIWGLGEAAIYILDREYFKNNR